MEVAAFVERHPRLFHMAEAGAWPWIQQHGLLSTTALLDLFEVSGSERFKIESERRPQIVAIEHERFGRAQVRDNKPLREAFLAPVLEDGMTPRDWYELLNRKVFFWVRPERLETLLSARAYRARAHDVLTIDTRALVERYESAIMLAHINTGATLYPSAPRRGRGTFQSIADYDLEAMVRRRGRQDAIVELAVDYAVRDVEAMTIAVARRFRDDPGQVLWHRQ